jgi:hypothetical protein
MGKDIAAEGQLLSVLSTVPARMDTPVLKPASSQPGAVAGAAGRLFKDCGRPSERACQGPVPRHR